MYQLQIGVYHDGAGYNKVRMIKLVRGVLGCGLKEAKDVVERRNWSNDNGYITDVDFLVSAECVARAIAFMCHENGEAYENNTRFLLQDCRHVGNKGTGPIMEGEG